MLGSSCSFWEGVLFSFLGSSYFVLFSFLDLVCFCFFLGSVQFIGYVFFVVFLVLFMFSRGLQQSSFYASPGPYQGLCRLLWTSKETGLGLSTVPSELGFANPARGLRHPRRIVSYSSCSAVLFCVGVAMCPFRTCYTLAQFFLEEEPVSMYRGDQTKYKTPGGRVAGP